MSATGAPSITFAYPPFHLKFSQVYKKCPLVSSASAPLLSLPLPTVPSSDARLSIYLLLIVPQGGVLLSVGRGFELGESRCSGEGDGKELGGPWRAEAVSC